MDCQHRWSPLSALAALQERRQRLLLAALVPCDEGFSESADAARAVREQQQASGTFAPSRASASLRRLHPAACAAVGARRPALLTSLKASGGAAAGASAATGATPPTTSSVDAAPPTPLAICASARKRLPWAHLREREAAAAAADDAWAQAQRSERGGAGTGAAAGDEGAAEDAQTRDLEALVAAMMNLDELALVANSHADVYPADVNGGSSDVQSGEQHGRQAGVQFVRPDVEAAIRDNGSPQLRLQHRLIMAEGWLSHFSADGAAADDNDAGTEGHASGGSAATGPHVRARAAVVERAIANLVPSHRAVSAAQAVRALEHHRLQYRDLCKSFNMLCTRDVTRVEAVLQQNPIVCTVLHSLAPAVCEGPGQPARVQEGLPMPLDTLLSIARSLRGSCFSANAATRKLERFQKTVKRGGGGSTSASAGDSSSSSKSGSASGAGGSSSGTGSSNDRSAAIEMAVLRHDAAATRDWEQLVALARTKGSPTGTAALCVLKDAVIGLALLCEFTAGRGTYRAAADGGDGGPLIPLACATTGALYRCSVESVRRRFCPGVVYTCLAYGPTRMPAPTSLEAHEEEGSGAVAPWAGSSTLGALAYSWGDAETESALGPPPARFTWDHTKLLHLDFVTCGPLLAAEAALRMELLYGAGAVDPWRMRDFVDHVITARLEHRRLGLVSLARIVAERDAAYDGFSGRGGRTGGRARGSSGSGAVGLHEPSDYGAGLFEAFYEEWDSASDSGEGQLELEGGPDAAGQSAPGDGGAARLLRRLQLPLLRHVHLDVPFTPWGQDTLEGAAELLRGVFRATEAFVRAACARLRQQGRPAPLPGVEGSWYEELISSVHLWQGWFDQACEHRSRLLDRYQLEAAGYGGAQEDATGSGGGMLELVLQKVGDAMDSGAAEAEEELRSWQQRCRQRARCGVRQAVCSGGGGGSSGGSEDDELAEDTQAQAEEEAARRARWRRRRHAAGRWLTGRRLIDAAEALRPGLLLAHTDSWAKLLLASAAATAHLQAEGVEDAEEADAPLVFKCGKDLALLQTALTALWGLCLLRRLPADQLPHMRLSTVLAVAANQRCEAREALEEYRVLQDDSRRRHRFGSPTRAEEQAQETEEEVTYDGLAEFLASGTSNSLELFNVLSRLPSPFLVRPEPAWAAWPADPPVSPTAFVREAAALEGVSEAGGEADSRLEAARNAYAARQLPCMLQLYERHGGLLVSLAEAVGWLRGQWQRRQAAEEAAATTGPTSTDAGSGAQHEGRALAALLEEAVAAAAEAGAAAVAGEDSESDSGLLGAALAAPGWGADQLREWRALLQRCVGEALFEVGVCVGLCDEGGALSGLFGTGEGARDAGSSAGGSATGGSEDSFDRQLQALFGDGSGSEGLWGDSDW